MLPAVFLDRDGVLNKSIVIDGKPYAPKFYKDFRLYDHTVKSLKMIKSLGFRVIIITNQPDIGNNKVNINDTRMMCLLQI